MHLYFLEEQEQALEKTNGFSDEAQRTRHGPVSPPSACYSGTNRQPESEDDSSSGVEDLSIEVDEPKNSPDQQSIGEEQYEVERIISRTVNADGSYLYHVKWVGYETSSDAENFVEEKDMMCPDLIKEFEDLERLRKKQRAKKLEQQAELARRKKLEAEQRERSVVRNTSLPQSSRKTAQTVTILMPMSAKLLICVLVAVHRVKKASA
ncbi:chromo' (CHRromatin Organization MOdifier) domain protein [Ancylostoma caninum]|uniref:Chromo' (CHRromatin Organization MOdifier) domain protein n=1 Tax=Ancylostoma caninum TaxID=29170 RepID=A0A368GRH8_ANCCA|nr:chromo' (CHRromatin Organization MOdifier) domain protein [Ancylostoma caninum]